MKAKELAQCYELAIRILKRYPDMELVNALASIDQDLENASIRNQIAPTTAISKPALSENATIPTAVNQQAILQQIDTVSTDNLESFLRASSAWKKKEHLQALAKQLGVEFGAKHTKEQLLQMIVNHFALLRMHAMIREHESSSTHL